MTPRLYTLTRAHLYLAVAVGPQRYHHIEPDPKGIYRLCLPLACLYAPRITTRCRMNIDDVDVVTVETKDLQPFPLHAYELAAIEALTMKFVSSGHLTKAQRRAIINQRKRIEREKQARPDFKAPTRHAKGSHMASTRGRGHVMERHVVEAHMRACEA